MRICYTFSILENHDVVEALRYNICLGVEPQARAFFESLASFYRNPWIK